MSPKYTTFYKSTEVDHGTPVSAYSLQAGAAAASVYSLMN